MATSSHQDRSGVEGFHRLCLKWMPYIILVMIVLAGVIYLFRDYFTLHPSQKKVEFKQIYKVSTDKEKHQYVISNYKQDLDKYDSKGSLVFHKHLTPQKSKTNEFPDRSYYTFNEVITDQQGRIYTLVSLMDYNGLEIIEEEILRFLPDGTLDRDWGSFKNTNTGIVSRQNQIKALWMEEEQLHIFKAVSVDADKPYTLQQIVFNDKGHITNNSEQDIIKLPEFMYVDEITPLSKKHFFYTTSRAELFEYDLEKGEKPLDLSHVVSKYPKGLMLSREGEVYFIDDYSSTIRKIDLTDSTLTESRELISLDSIGKADNSIRSMASLGQQNIVLALEDQLLFTDKDGKTKEFEYSSWMIFCHILLYLMGILFIILFVLLLVISYWVYRPLSVFRKQIFIIMPVLTLMVSGFLFLLYEERDIPIKEMRRGLDFASHVGENLIDGKQLQSFSSPKDYMNEEYKKLNDKLTYGDDNAKFYSTVYRYDPERHEKIYIAQNDSNSEMMNSVSIIEGTSCVKRNKGSGEWEDVIMSELNQYFRQGNNPYLTCEYPDEAGEWMYGLAPIYENKGSKTVVGFYEAGINMYPLHKRISDLFTLLIKLFLGSLILVGFILFGFLRYQQTRLAALETKAGNIEKRNWPSLKVIPYTYPKDEIDILGESLERMATTLKTYIIQAQKFVPEPFIKLLKRGEEDFEQIFMDPKLEHRHTSEKMAILAATVRVKSKEGSTIQWKPPQDFQEMKKVLDDICQPMMKHVDNRTGFISAFLSDGFTALFELNESGSPALAVQTALEIQDQLDTLYGQQEKYKLDIAIHVGQLELGIIGVSNKKSNKDQWETGVISEDHQIAIEINKLCSVLGCSLLVSKYAMDGLPADQEVWKESRFLGYFKHRYLDEIGLFDVFKMEREAVRTFKKEQLHAFEEAREKFQQSAPVPAHEKLTELRRTFLDLVDNNRTGGDYVKDKVSILYYCRCDDDLEDTPDEWSPVINLDKHN